MSKSETRQKATVLGVRLTEEDYEEASAHAEAHNMTLPALMRLLLALHLDRCKAGQP